MDSATHRLEVVHVSHRVVEAIDNLCCVVQVKDTLLCLDANLHRCNRLRRNNGRLECKHLLVSHEERAAPHTARVSNEQQEPQTQEKERSK
jgi:hypothetical protein